MSRKGNGSAQILTAAVDLSPYSVLTVAYWLWWDAYASDGKAAFGNAPSAGVNLCYETPNSFNGAFFEIGMYTGLFWADSFPRPSAAAWHHYTIVHDRATPKHLAWVDGVAQTLSTIVHTAASYGNFGNGSCRFLTDNITNYGAGRMAEVGVWGVQLPASAAVGLASGADPLGVSPANLVGYWPFLGDSPEPDYSGKQLSATVSGATVVNHPGVQSMMRRRRRAVV